eukprot:2405599-Amphidinium_carterae.1
MPWDDDRTMRFIIYGEDPAMAPTEPQVHVQVGLGEPALLSTHPSQYRPGEAWAQTSPSIMKRSTRLLEWLRPETTLPSQTTVSWTYELLPGCPANVIRANKLAASGEQEPRSSTGCTREELFAISWKRQRLRIATYKNGKPHEKELVSQPKGMFVCTWYVACVRTLVCRTLAAALLKRPNLRQICPGAWTLPLDISVNSYNESSQEADRYSTGAC